MNFGFYLSNQWYTKFYWNSITQKLLNQVRTYEFLAFFDAIQNRKSRYLNMHYLCLNSLLADIQVIYI